MKPLDDFPLTGLHFVKIDVEGMEREVIAGARATLQKFRPLMYVENDREQKAVELIRFIDSLDFVMYWHCPLMFNRDNYAGNSENIFQNIISKNMLCVPKEMDVTLTNFQKIEVV